jgi:hypothetical protein
VRAELPCLRDLHAPHARRHVVCDVEANMVVVLGSSRESWTLERARPGTDKFHRPRRLRELGALLHVSWAGSAAPFQVRLALKGGIHTCICFRLTWGRF